MKSFEIIHTITSPYRIHMFNIMNEILTSKGINFHVHFMSNVTSHRPDDWSSSYQSIDFNHTFWKDRGPRAFGNKWHFNPGILKHILQRDIDILLIGGPWASLTTFMSTFIAKSNTKKIAWIEGNANTINSSQLRTLFIKKIVLNRFDYCAIPGIRGIEYINRITNNSYPENRILKLPNIINETKFEIKSSEHFNKINEIAYKLEIDLSPTIKTAFIPARLIPEKGLIEFFSTIDVSLLTNWQIIVAGKGPLKNNLIKLLSKRNLSNRVKVIEPINYHDMPLLYKISDLFIIPSVKDNNPLTLIEALHSGLPVLASKNVGNYPEALKIGINGWSIDPNNAQTVIKSSEIAFSCSKEKLKSMGLESKRIAKINWAGYSSIKTFLKSTGCF